MQREVPLNVSACHLGSSELLMLQNKCPEATYLESADFFTLCSHIISLITIPTNILGVLLIYHKTPPRMQKMKLVLLNCHIWGLIGDLMLGTLIIPYVFFPLIAGFPLGILTRVFNVNTFFQIYIGVACVEEVATATVFLFENRHSQTVTSSFKLTTRRSRQTFYALNFIAPFINSLFCLIRIPDQDSAKHEMLRELPCPTIEYYRFPTVIVTTDATSMGVFLFLLAMFYASQFLFFVVHSSLYLFFTTRTVSVSEKTRKLKQKYFWAVCIQVTIPISVLVFPVVYFFFSIITNTYNPTANIFCFLLMSSHGFLGTIATVLIFENYRSYVLQVLQFKRNCDVATVVTSKNLAIYI